MTQRGGFDWTEVQFLEETVFGTTNATGLFKHLGNITNFNPKRVPNILPRIGIGKQIHSARKLVKQHWKSRVEYNLLTKDTSPAYNWTDFLDMAVNKDGSNNPTNQPNWFTLGGKADLTTDEFVGLKGGAIETFEVRGESVEDRIKAVVDSIHQSGDYSTTDYVVAPVTRTAAHDSAEVVFGEADLWYDIATTPDVADTIYSRLNSWSWKFRRDLRMRGVDATTSTLYREFVAVQRWIELEINLDFDSKTEYEHFIDDQGFYMTLRIPSASGGVQIAMTGGRWIDGELPIRELDLMGVVLRGDFQQMAVTDIA